MFLRVLEWIDSRRKDEEYGCGGAGFLKGDGEIYRSTHHVLTAQLFLHKISVQRNTGLSFGRQSITHCNLRN